MMGILLNCYDVIFYTNWYLVVQIYIYIYIPNVKSHWILNHNISWCSALIIRFWFFLSYANIHLRLIFHLFVAILNFTSQKNKTLLEIYPALNWTIRFIQFRRCVIRQVYTHDLSEFPETLIDTIFLINIFTNHPYEWKLKR